MVFAEALFGPHVENLRGRTEVFSSRGTVSALRALVMDTGYSSALQRCWLVTPETVNTMLVTDGLKS